MHQSRLRSAARQLGCCAALLGAFFMTGACTTVNTARPLKPGQHGVSVTLGGPIADIPNIGPIPFPHMTVEGRHGLIDDLDINYGLHLLPALFGVAGGHMGATWLAMDQEAWIPAVSAGQRLFVFSNRLDDRKAADSRAEWLLSQTDLTASWLLYDQLVYAGATAYIPVLQPQVFLAPFAGVEFRPGVDWLRLQLEARYLAPYINTQYGVVNWVSPGNQGGILVNAGLAFVFDFAEQAK